MADPVRRDEPLNVRRFPESPSNTVRSYAEEQKLLAQDTPSRPLGEWPWTDVTEAAISEDTPLHRAGERVGGTLGNAVAEARALPARLQDRMQELKQRFRVISGRKSAEIKDRAAELTGQAHDRINGIATEAGERARYLQFRTRLYARQNPFQFIAGAAAAGFVIGFLLRLGRHE